VRRLLEIRLQLARLSDDTLRTRLVDSPEGEITEIQPFPVGLTEKLEAGGPTDDFFMHDTDEVAKIGRILFRSLGRVGRWLSGYRSFGGGQEQMRLYLHVDDPSLAALPWEIIHDDRHFLCLGTDLSLIRVWGGLTPPLRLSPVDRLTILSVLAEPKNRPPTRFGPGPTFVEEALALSLEQGQIKLRSVAGGELERFRELLADGPHLIHYFGYQEMHNSTPALVFVDADHQAQVVDSAQLHDWLRALGDRLPRVVIIAGQDESGRGLSTSAGLARAILQAGVPVVVGFQGALDEKAFWIFTRTLYQALADQLDLDQALAHARVAINSQSSGRDGAWAVPVLYSNGPLPDSLLAFRDTGYGQLYTKSYESSQVFLGTGRGGDSAPPSSGMNATDAYLYGQKLRKAIQGDTGLSAAERISLRVLVEKLEDALADGADADFIQSMLDELSVFSNQAAGVADEMRRKLLG
jgi:hypothetical protein